MFDAAEFTALACRNPANPALLDRLAGLNLPGCHLTAGCLFQTVWNILSGRPPAENIKDYDVFYFDGSDLSWEAEDRVIRSVAAATADLGLPIEVKNQARVHLWYKARFGDEYPRLSSARDGIARYLIACTCVGIEVSTGMPFAPHGLEDLQHGILRINPIMPKPNQWIAKAESYQARWPWLRVAA